MRTADGLGVLHPIEQSEASKRSASIIRAIESGDYAMGLVAVAHNVQRVDEAPMVRDILNTLTQTAAAEVRSKAEKELQQELEARGFSPRFTAQERQQLRNEIALSIEADLLATVSEQGAVSAADLRLMAHRSARATVAENLAAYSE